MSVELPTLPAALRERAGKAGAVRPLLPPGWRALLPLLLGVAVGLAAFLVSDHRREGAVWGPVAARLLAAAWLSVLALREGSPSEGATRPARILGVLLGAIVLLASAEWVAAGTLPAGTVVPHALHCFLVSTALALPAAIAVAWLLLRAYPLRPLFAGAAGGLAAGLVADSVLHATCPAVARSHTLLAHSGAVAAITVLAATLVVAGRRGRRRTM